MARVLVPLSLIVPIPFPANSGVVLSLEEVEGGMNRMRLGTEQPQVHRKVSPPQRGDGTPFMAEHLEEALTGGSCVRPRSHDPDMSAFNKLVSSMKASGTLPPHHPKANSNNVSLTTPTMCHQSNAGRSLMPGNPKNACYVQPINLGLFLFFLSTLTQSDGHKFVFFLKRNFTNVYHKMLFSTFSHPHKKKIYVKCQ